MKPKTMILMVVAVGCGLGASYMTSRLLAERNRQAPPVPTVPVLVAKARVPAWQPIKEPEKLFEIKQFPQDVAPKKALGDFAAIKDQRLRNFLDEGKPVGQDDLVSKEQADLAAQILPGQRATAIKVNAETLAGGFIVPGARVDVVCTIRGGDVSSKVILQNMLVLAVDQVDTKNPEQKTFLAQTVTLAATPEEAGRLSLAGSMGELRLWLRNHGDQERIAQLTIRPADLDRPLVDGKQEATEPEPREVKPAPGGNKVEVPLIPEDTKEEKKEEKTEEKAKEPTLPEPQEDEEPRPAKREVTPAPRKATVMEERPAAPRRPKKHSIYIREGATQRTEVVDTARRDDAEEGEEAGDGGPEPVPARREEKAAPPAASTKTGRPRTN